MDDREIRTIEGEVELRGEGEGQARTVSGYAVKWGELSGQIGQGAKRFRERFERGAFSESLRSKPVTALWNHNADYPLANTENGMLRLEEDEIGLRFEMELPDTSWGHDAHESIRKRLVKGMSFGFRGAKDKWSGKPGDAIRSVRSAELLEISPTPFPAYPQTQVEARSESWDEFVRESTAREELRSRELRLIEAAYGLER